MSIKFLKKTVKCIRGATYLGVAVFLFGFVFTQSAEASTTFEENGTGQTLTADFVSCATAQCRGDLLYISRGLTLPVGTVFDRVRIKTTSAVQQPRIYLYTPFDTGVPRTACSDGACVADDTYGSPLVITSVSNIGGGVWEYRFSTQTISSTGKYFYISLDPNTPYQSTTIYRSNTGQVENGFNHSGFGTGFQYQLCLTTCDNFGNYTPLSLYNFSSTLQTRFLSAGVTGAQAAVSFNLSYFIHLQEINATNRPDYVNISILKDDATADAQVSTLKQIILPLSEGTTTRSFVSDYNHVNNANYIAYINFFNIQGNAYTFTNSAYTVKYSIVGGVVSNVVVIGNQNALVSNNAYSLEDCKLLDLGCGLRNAFKFLFVPSTDSVQQFLDLKTALFQKAPFIYLKQSSDIFITVYQNPSGSIPTISVPFLAGSVTLISQSQISTLPFVGTVRSLVSMGIYLTLLYGLYRMVLRVHDKTV